jgi:hypothetical protein
MKRRVKPAPGAWFVGLGAVLGAVTLYSAAGQERDRTVRELTVLPAPPPRPALRWRLLPTLAERKPGNAVPFYYRAVLRLKNRNRDLWKTYEEKSEEWLSATPERYPRQEVRQWLAQQPSALNDLKVAAFRETCDWEMRPQDLEGMQTIMFLLEEVQEARTLARLVQVQAHAELMDGQYAEAFQTLRLGYRLGSDVSRQGFLVSTLVGVAIISVMNEELLHLMERSPDNYYWALAADRQRLIDWQQAVEVERRLPQKLLPILERPAEADLSPDAWRKRMAQSLANLFQTAGAEAGLLSRAGETSSQWAAAALVSATYPQAKQRLREQGWDSARLEAMPAAQVVAIDAAATLDTLYDDLFACFTLPYPQARPRLQALERELHQRPRPQSLLTGGIVAMTGLLMPALSSFTDARARLDQQLAALQAIEALRMHAAQTGQWPDRLEEVTIVPVPKDPVNEAPFRYRREGETAILEPSEGLTLPHQPIRRYVLRLKHP